MSKNKVNPYSAGFIFETQNYIQHLFFGLLKQRDELTQQRDELTQQRDELTQQRDELTAELSKMVAERERITHALTSERDQIAVDRDSANTKLEAVVNSRIWRFTKFYRESGLRKPKRQR